MYMAVGTHWTACGWFLIACSSLSIGAMDPHTCNVGSWALKFSDVPLSKFRPCTQACSQEFLERGGYVGA